MNARGDDATRMRVTFYLPTLAGGGAERTVLFIASKFANAGHEVRLLVDRAEGSLAGSVPRNVELRSLNSRSVLRSVPKLLRVFADGWEDVVVSSLPANNVAAIAALTVCRSRARRVLWEHSNLSRSATTLKHRVIRAMALLLYPRADAVIAVSEGVRRDLLGHSKVEGSRVHTLYNPTPHAQPEGSSAAPHSWLRTGREEKVIISAGRLTYPKDFRTLIKAHAMLGDDTKLIILGEGPDRPELERYATELGTRDRLCFAGFVPNPLLWMRFADVFALSSRYEGFGNVLIEAMSVGLPVVSTDCESGPSEILEAGRYGTLVPVGDDLALATALKRTLSQPPQSQHLIMRAGQFDIVHLWPGFERAITGLL